MSELKIFENVEFGQPHINPDRRPREAPEAERI